MCIRDSGPGSARAPGFSGSSWAPRSSQSPFASGNSVPDPYALPDTSWSTWQILLAVLAGIVGLVVLVLVFFASAGAVFVAIALVTLGIGSVLRRSRSRDGF